MKCVVRIDDRDVNETRHYEIEAETKGSRPRPRLRPEGVWIYIADANCTYDLRSCVLRIYAMCINYSQPVINIHRT